MKFLISNKHCRRENGQTLVMFVFFLIVLILFVGLGVDLGFAYVTKANLSKAVDAAALVAMKNFSLGTLTAQDIGSATFAANYGKPSRDVNGVRPNATFTWSMDSSSNTILNVKANTTINTFFIRVLPTWKTLSVSANAQSTRAKLIMMLVLDRSGSMNPTTGTSKGGAALPGAVRTFINNFDDNNDVVGMASFASTATVDVSIRKPFKTDIINAANGLAYDGGTFAQGGLTNGLAQINGVTVLPGENVIKVVVFFTDGLANIIQDRLNCPPQTTWNFGGYDSGSTVGFFNPTAVSQDSVCTTSGGSPSCCSGTSQFRSAVDGTLKSFTRANVSGDAEYRSIQVANDMRAAGMIVYSIGLGSGVDQAFLQQVAGSPDNTVIAPSNAQLNDVFQTIAAKILLRLTQ